MKITYGTNSCELGVSENFTYSCEDTSEDALEFDKDSVAYAVVQYFKKNNKLRKFCTHESWQVRLAKGKDKKGTRFEKVGLPAYLMGLPGDYVQVKGFIDAVGVSINRVDITLDHEFDEEDEVEEAPVVENTAEEAVTEEVTVEE